MSAWYEDTVIPALLRWGRMTYGEAMRKALCEADCDDLPRDGMFVIGSLAMASGTASLGSLVKGLGGSKQAAGQLVDTLVLRGYVKRLADEEDRRKLTVALTERGWHAAAIQRAVRERIDAALADRAGADTVAAGRRMLAALIETGRHAAAAEAVPAARCHSVMPILPSTDLARTKAFYGSLGFTIQHQEDGFLMMGRDAIELAFSLKPQHDPRTMAGCVYVRVTSSDALHQLWKGIEGVKEPRDQDYRMRDLPVADPDNNLILFGSPIV